MKGTILADHYLKNRFTLTFTPTGGSSTTISPVAVTGWDEEIDTVDLPDRTRASGGVSQPVDITVRIPLHHEQDILVMDKWWDECHGATVASTYKKSVILTHKKLSGATYAHTWNGAFINKRTLPDLEMENEGEEVEVEYGFSVDDIEEVKPAK